MKTKGEIVENCLPGYTNNFAEEHVYIGIKSLRSIIEKNQTVEHLRFEW